MADDSHRGSVSALVADDDDLNARLLVRILERGGFGKIECTTDSEAVLPLCESLRPDLLLLDVSMPKPNGFEILEAIRESPGSGPVVVMLTGHAHPSIERRALELGAAAVVGKTVSMEDLLGQLDRVLTAAGVLPEEDIGA